MNRRLFLALVPAALVAGCGFQLRRHDGMPFSSLYIDAPGSAVAQRVRAMLATDKKLKLVDTSADAEVVLKIAGETRNKTILSLSGAGRVTEYRLSLHLEYAISSRDEHELAVPEKIELNSDMTYDDSLLLAKGAEEQLLYRDMEDTAALRIVRRLQALPPAGI